VQTIIVMNFLFIFAFKFLIFKFLFIKDDIVILCLKYLFFYNFTYYLLPYFLLIILFILYYIVHSFKERKRNIFYVFYTIDACFLSYIYFWTNANNVWFNTSYITKLFLWKSYNDYHMFYIIYKVKNRFIELKKM